MTNKQIDFFDKYLNGLLSKTELLEFQDRLENDAQLKNDFDHYKVAIEQIREEGIMREIENIHKKNNRTLGTIVHWIWLILFMSSLVLFYVFFTRNNKGEQNIRKLILANYIPHPDELTVRSNASIIDMKSYNLKQYRNFIFELNNNGTPHSENEIFYKAQAHLALKQVDSFNFVIDKISSKSKYYSYIPWYKIVALSMNDAPMDEIKNALNKIDSSHFNFNASQAILDEIH